ncbi:MAG: TonB-dependent receptor [Bacteroidota bacterium]
MRLLLTSVLSLLLATVSWAQSSLNGTITDPSGEPLPGASVLLDEIQRSTTTDEDGFFRFDKLQEGNYTLIISYIGYQGEQQSIELSDVQNLEFTLQPTSYRMTEIEVLDTWADDKTPVTYTNLNKEQLEQNNLGQDVPFLLRWTPSAVVTSDAGTGIGYTGIRIRGSDPTRINVTINGIPLNDAESQGTFWVDLPDFVSSTEGVQIQRGVGTSTNGAGAFGATISLNTAKVHKKPYLKIANGVGSFNTLRHNIQGGSGLLGGKFTLDGRLSRITSDGYIDRASAKLHSFYFSGAMIDDKQSLRLNVFSGHEVTYQAWNGVPYTYIDSLRTYNSAGTERSGEPHDNEVDDYTQTHYQLHYNRQLSSNLELKLAGHYTRGKGFFEQYKADESPEDYGLAGDEETDLIRRRWLDNHFYGVTYGLTHRPNDDLQIILGGALSNYEGRHFGEVIWTELQGEQSKAPIYYDNDAEKLDFNIYGKLAYQLTPRLNAYLDLQYRMVDYDFLGNIQDINGDLQRVDQTAKLNFFNPKAGLFFEIDSHRQLYASFGVANREPNRNDFTESSTASRPDSERLLNTEIGYREQWQRFNFGVNLYHMAYKDQLVLTGRINDVGEATRVNVPDSYRAGIEVDARAILAKGLELGTTATFSRNKIKRFVEFIDRWDAPFGQLEVVHEDSDLAFSPNVIWSGELSYDVLQGRNQRHDLKVSLLSKFVGEQFIDNTSNENTRLPSYSFSDFRLQYNFRPRKAIEEINLKLTVRNLFDAKFSTNAWAYRYQSVGYNAVGIEPHTRLEDASQSIYNQTGLYPQAGRNFLLGLTLSF